MGKEQNIFSDQLKFTVSCHLCIYQSSKCMQLNKKRMSIVQRSNIITC